MKRTVVVGGSDRSVPSRTYERGRASGVQDERGKSRKVAVAARPS